MSNCYTFESLTYDTGIFDSVADCTFIITMEGSPRKPSFLKQLQQYPLTKRVIILTNQGYKSCPKKICETKQKQCTSISTPAVDLIHANLEIVQYCLSHNIDNCIVLEDDFIISDSILDPTILSDFQSALHKYRNSNLFIYFGLLPWLTTRYHNNFRRAFLSTGTHAVLLNKNAMTFIKQEAPSYFDYDYFTSKESLTGNLFTLSYKTPLIYQTFPETENKRKWGEGMTLSQPLVWFTKTVMFLLKLDKQTEPGYTFMYNLNILLYDILPLFLLIYFILRTSNFK